MSGVADSVIDLLKPRDRQQVASCPFCGNRAEQRGVAMEKENGTTVFAIECGSCGAMGPQRDELEEAARAWNRRPDRV
jgi:Lar family restriction alleviation protein